MTGFSELSPVGRRCPKLVRVLRVPTSRRLRPKLARVLRTPIGRRLRPKLVRVLQSSHRTAGGPSNSWGFSELPPDDRQPLKLVGVLWAPTRRQAAPQTREGSQTSPPVGGGVTSLACRHKIPVAETFAEGKFSLQLVWGQLRILWSCTHFEFNQSCRVNSRETLAHRQHSRHIQRNTYCAAHSPLRH